MKKIFIPILLLAVMLVAGGCEKQQPIPEDRELLMTESQVKQEVQTWMVYTNPQFRYELRSPKRWDFFEKDENNDDVAFYPSEKTLSDDYFGAVRVFGYVNWHENYTLEEYFQNVAQEDLFAKNYEHEEFKLRKDDSRAVWFKNVDCIYEGQIIDVIAMDGNDRIVLFYIMEEWETSRTIFNSFYFYGNKSISVDIEPIEEE